MRPKRYSLLIAIAAIALALASCKSHPVAPEQHNAGDTSVLMTLAIGNQWIRHNPFDSQAPYDTLRIVRDTTLDGAKWFVGSDGNIYANRSDGLYTWNQSAHRAERQAKFPVKLGDTAIDRGWFPGVDTAGIVIDSTHNFAIVTDLNLTVTVPAGTFNCWRALYYYYTVGAGHEPSLNTVYEYVYYAPGIGEVKAVVLSGAASNNNYVTTFELAGLTLR
jgi:hypothetical protein